MKCPKCGMKYEGNECPNCAVEKILYSSSPQYTGGKIPQFRNEAEYDAYMAKEKIKEEERKLKKGVNRWRIAFYVFLMLAISFEIVYLLGIAVDDKMTQGISGIFSRSLFIVSIICLLFYYLSDIRRQLILLNKKK